MIRGRLVGLVSLLVACQGEPEPAPKLEPPKLEPAKLEPPKLEPAKLEPAKLEPATIPAPVWTAPTPTRARLPFDESIQSRDLQSMLGRMIAAENCPLVDGWFGPCEQADELVAALEPIGNG